MSDRFRTFDEFWPYYVREHSKPLTRKFHFVGTAAAMGFVAAAVKLRRPSLLAAAMVAGYGPAWVSHFFIEKNKPATFQYPLWSLLSDFKMFGMMLRGEMDAEVARVMANEEANKSGKTASPNDPVPAHAPADPHSVN
jgi:hypothetical protein